MGYQQKLGEIDSKHKIRITGASGVNNYVDCPLPDNFGFTVGSVFSTPFDTGAISGLLAKPLAATDVGLAQTISMNKVFMNPEPTEISFEMEFSAFYSAKTEVLAPIIKLLQMSLSSKLTVQKSADKIQDLINRLSGLGVSLSDSDNGISNAAEQSEFTKTTGDAALGLIGFLQAPSTVNIMFGDLIYIRDAFVSNVGVRFSNKLDISGIPMSATCSVSIILQRPPTIETIADEWFSGIGDL